MSQEQQALSDIPFLLLVVLAIASGVSGEMWRADKAGLRGWALIRRICLRSGASVVFGASTSLLLWSAGVSLYAALAIGFVVATMGADVATALYERWLAKRAGVCEVRRDDGDS